MNSLADWTSKSKWRIEQNSRVFEKGDPQISNLLFGPVLRTNIAVVDVPVWRDGKVAYDLAASLPLSIFTDVIMRQRPEPDWTIAVFDREGTVIARSRDNEQFVGRPASPSLYADLMNRFEGALDTTTSMEPWCCRGSLTPHSQDGVLLSEFRSHLSQLSSGARLLSSQPFGIVCLAFGTLFAVRLATQLALTGLSNDP